MLRFKLRIKEPTGAGARFGAEIEAEAEVYIGTVEIGPEPEDGPEE